MNDLSFSKLTRNTKSKWACIDCKSELHTKTGNQSNNEGNGNIRQLKDSVQCMSEKFNQFNKTVVTS